MTTIRDVAKLAGVAPITVSRVINGQDHVSPETGQKVRRAIEELSYIPNALGPSLRTKRTGMLALVLSDIINPFWTTVARGMEDAANRHDHHVIICYTDESPEKEAEYLDFLLRKQIDGFLLLPPSNRSLERLQKHGAHVVVLDRRVPGISVDTVRGDSEAGAHDLVKHLLDLGHERIAVVTGPADVSTSIDRVAGYERALAEAGLAGHRDVHWGTYTQESGGRSTREALRGSPRPTAIFAANNFLAIGAMRALRDLGLRVPEDVSVVAFDDLPASLSIEPFFTAGAQPAYEMGARAAELLLERLADTGPDGPREIVLPIEIIVRRSSASPSRETRPGRQVGAWGRD
jgi:LacI family transcriptional regulator